MTSRIDQLPPYVNLMVRHAPRRGFLEANFDVSRVVIDDRVVFSRIMFSTPKPIAGLLSEARSLGSQLAEIVPAHAPATVWLSFGYLCSACDKIIMVRDSFTNAASLSGLLDHACTNPDEIFDLGEFRRLLHARKLNREAKFELYKLLTEINAESTDTDKESL